MTEPKCPVFGLCGGCTYQDKEYSAQLVIKKQETEMAFKRAGVEIPGLENLKFFVKDEYFYRNRMDFAFNANGLGLREKGKFNKLVGFEVCYISNEVINSLLAEVNAWFRANKDRLDVFDVVKRTGTMRYAVSRGSFFSKDSSITFIMNKDSDRLEHHINMIKEFAAGSKAKNILYGLVKYNTDVSSVDDAVVVKGGDCLEENLGPLKYLYHTQGFFQVNSLVTMDMIFYMKDKMTIIFFSGNLDKAMAMLILAATGASMGMDVKVFFTFWGLNFLKKKRSFMNKNILQKMMEFMMPKNRNSLPLSQMDMLGAGTGMMKTLMAKKKMPSIDELLALAKQMEVKFYACSTSCGMMGLDKDNMIEGVDDVVGATLFLSEAKDAKINLFI